MKKALIHRFFKELDRELGRPAEIILTGAAAGSLLGVIRPSVDLDFEIRIRSKHNLKGLFIVKEAIQKVSEKEKIAVNYSEDIGRWSMIDPLDYRKTALPYHSIGKLRLRIIDPEHWTIGKLGRFLEVDIRDVLRMIKRRKLNARHLISLWGRALRSSPLSLNLGDFRRNVVHFIRCYGKRAWGRTFDVPKGVSLFERSAGLK